MIKSFKIRLYPTKEQEQSMWKHIGSCRFIWNYMIALQEERYKNGEKHLSGFDMIYLLKPLKNDGEHEWLYEVSNASLTGICRDVADAYSRFFKKTSKHPKFKSRKRAKPNYPVRNDGLWFDENAFVHISKIGKVKFKTDFVLPTGKGVKFSNPRISYKQGSNKWMLSFGMECENQVHELSDKAMGIDLGVKETMTVAFGNDMIVFHSINKSRKMRMLNKSIKHTQRAISRKYEANRCGNKYVKTKNIERLEQKLRRLHERRSNIRNNYIHQSTHSLVSMLPYKVVMEDLNVQGMMKNRHLSKAIQEQCFYEIIRQMKYKCEWNGVEFLQVDRFYPSSKTCSKCGQIKSDLKLSDRTFKCECGFVADRDFNAALNLQRYVA